MVTRRYGHVFEPSASRIAMPWCKRGIASVAAGLALCGCDGTVRTGPQNQAPVAVGTIPAQATRVADSTALDAAPYFNDPDGDALTYSAGSADLNLATVLSLAGSIVTIGGIAAGETVIEITATDPGGLTATQKAPVTVTGPFLRYDFNSDGDLSGWTPIGNTNAQVRGGNLEVSKRERDWIGLVGHYPEFQPTLTDWEVTVRMARAETNVNMVVWLSTTHDLYRAYRIEVGSGVEIEGSPTNYRLWALHDDAEVWVYFSDGAGWGWSDEIADAAGEFSVLKWSVIDGTLRIHSNSTLIHQHALGDWRPSEIQGIGLGVGAGCGGSGVGSCDSPHRFVRGTTLFDWVTLERKSR